MVKFENSKIYKIIVVTDDTAPCYVGSTTRQYLSTRFSHHKSDFNRWREGKTNFTTAYRLFEEYGIENCRLVLIENFECRDINELRAREGHFIRMEDCVNKRIAGRGSREYYIDNKEKIDDRVKQYAKDHEDERKEKHVCICGGRFTKSNPSQHTKSKKHLKFIATADQVAPIP